MTGAKNEEFIKFRNNILIVLAVTLICIAFVILLFGKGINSGPINKKIKNKETFLIYITSSDCDNCSEVRDFIDEKNVTYQEMTMTCQDGVLSMTYNLNDFTEEEKARFKSDNLCMILKKSLMKKYMKLVVKQKRYLKNTILY